VRPSTLPVPLRANLFDNLAAVPLSAQGMRCVLLCVDESNRGEPVPAMGPTDTVTVLMSFEGLS
jgi:hypothetical protein